MLIKNYLQKKLLIFDLDDTLIHSGINYGDMRERIIVLFDDVEKQTDLRKKPIADILKEIKKYTPEKLPLAEKIIMELEEASIKNAEIIPHAEKIPQLLDNFGLLYAILTNNTRKSVDRYIKSGFPFLKDFHIITRDDCKMKPDPDGILKIIQHYEKENISRRDVAFIGDSYIDSIASYHAGIDFIHFYSREVDFSKFMQRPILTLKHWSELTDLIIQNY